LGEPGRCCTPNSPPPTAERGEGPAGSPHPADLSRGATTGPFPWVRHWPC
jgi:hypothetical protein